MPPMNNDHGSMVIESDEVEILERRDAAIQGIPLFTAHWQVFVPSLVICILYLITWMILFFTGQASSSAGRTFIIVMAMITPLLAAWAFLRYQTIRLQVSGGHMYVHPGWPKEMPIDIPLELVESVSVKRGVTGRIFGGGSLAIQMSDGRTYTVTDISHAEEAERAILDGI